MRRAPRSLLHSTQFPCFPARLPENRGPSRPDCGIIQPMPAFTPDSHPELFSQQALNKAMLEAVDFVHAEGWDAPPTLFALLPSQLLVDVCDDSPLTLVVQDHLPELEGDMSEELGDYLAQISWPEEVVGVILAQEIRFAASPSQPTQSGRLFSGVLGARIEQTLLQVRPTEEELANGGLFAEDEVQLRGGDSIAPEVINALRWTLEP